MVVMCSKVVDLLFMKEGYGSCFFLYCGAS